MNRFESVVPTSDALYTELESRINDLTTDYPEASVETTGPDSDVVVRVNDLCLTIGEEYDPETGDPAGFTWSEYTQDNPGDCVTDGTEDPDMEGAINVVRQWIESALRRSDA